MKMKPWGLFALGGSAAGRAAHRGPYPRLVVRTREIFVQQRRVLPHVALGAILIAGLLGVPLPVNSQSNLSPGYAAGDAAHTASERAGREIWFYATAFNARP
jgi:hypothetical protein